MQGVVRSSGESFEHDYEKRFGKGRLSVARLADEQDSISRLDAVRTEQIGAMLLLDQFAAGLPNRIPRTRLIC
jgi:hypothetical protein